MALHYLARFIFYTRLIDVPTQTTLLMFEMCASSTVAFFRVPFR